MPRESHRSGVSSCVTRFLAYEASAADHPVGFLCAAATAAPAPAPTVSGRGRSPQQHTGSRSVDTWVDLHPTTDPQLFLSTVFLDVFTALQVLFGYLTLALWNYLSTYRDLALARYAEGGGHCYVRCTDLNNDTQGVADSAVVARAGDLCAVDSDCRTAPGAEAAAYLGLVTAGLTVLIGLTLFLACVNSSCVVRWSEKQWSAAHPCSALPVVRLSGPRYRFAHPVYWHAVDDAVAMTMTVSDPAGEEAREETAARRSHRLGAGAVDRSSHGLQPSDGKTIVLWLFSPLVVTLVALDGYLLVWSQHHPQLSRITTLPSSSSSVSSSFHESEQAPSSEGAGTVTVLQAFVLALGLAVILYTIRRVVASALRSCARACFRCAVMMDERGVM